MNIRKLQRSKTLTDIQCLPSSVLERNLLGEEFGKIRYLPTGRYRLFGDFAAHNSRHKRTISTMVFMLPLQNDGTLKIFLESRRPTKLRASMKKTSACFVLDISHNIPVALQSVTSTVFKVILSLEFLLKTSKHSLQIYGSV